MKKFLTKIFLFFGIIFLVTAWTYFVYMDKADPYGVRKFKLISDSIEVCNLGSSHGMYGFNYEDVEDVDCFNFGLVSQTLSYDARIFDNYKENIAEGAVVFIPVSYFSMFGNDECTRDGFADKNKRYYQILPPEMIKKYDVKTDIQVHFPLPDINWIKLMFEKAENEEEEFWLRKTSDIDVAEEVHIIYERHLVTDMLDENGNMILNQEEIDSLKYIIKSCQDMNVVPILVTVPYLQEYTDEIKNNNPHFYEEFYDLITEIISETNVAYYDYAFDQRFADRYDWYMNSDHLNKEGARQFVNILMDEVVHYGEKDSLIK